MFELFLEWSRETDWQVNYFWFDWNNVFDLYIIIIKVVLTIFCFNCFNDIYFTYQSVEFIRFIFRAILEWSRETEWQVNDTLFDWKNIFDPYITIIKEVLVIFCTFFHLYCFDILIDWSHNIHCSENLRTIKGNRLVRK